MIIYDKLGHMVSTENEEELHKFAKKLGLKKSWYQDSDKPHYDLTTKRMQNRAKKLGAMLVHVKDIIRQAWWNGDKTYNTHKYNNI